ncbi:MAG: APC family permease [Sciscionella sp.]
MQQQHQRVQARARYVELAAAASGASRLRSRSPVSGLDRRRLGPLQVLGQSVSGAAPTAAMAATPAIAAATAGQAAIWSFLVATGLALLIGSCIGHFTRRMAVAGSLYSLTAKGLGPVGGLACGVALLIGYGFLTMAGLVGSATYLTTLFSHFGVPAAVMTGGFVALLTAVLGALAVVLIRRGVRLSARVVLTVEALAITLMLLIFTVLLVRNGSTIHRFGVPPLQLRGVAAGVLPALGAFIGFEAAAALGVEARRPFSTIPKAVRWTAAACGLLYLFAVYVQQLEFADIPGGLAGQSQPLNVLAAAQHMPWLSSLLDAGITMSFFAAALAAGTALVRVLFSMGREGVAPQAMGRTHRRYRTPNIAVVTSLPVATAVPVLLLLAAGMSPAEALLVLLNTSVFGYLVAYLLVCLAAPRFLHRIGELTIGPVLATAVVAPVLLTVLAFFVVSQWGSATPIAWLLIAAAAAAWFGWLRLRRPQCLGVIGVYDETSAADLLGAPDENTRP